MRSAPISDDLLRLLAEDARVVILWAMKQRMKKDQQVEETVKAFKKRLAETVLNQEPRVEAEGQGRAGEVGHVEGSAACLPSDRAENKPCATAVIAGANSQIEPDVKADPVQTDVRLDLARAM